MTDDTFSTLKGSNAVPATKLPKPAKKNADEPPKWHSCSCKKNGRQLPGTLSQGSNSVCPTDRLATNSSPLKWRCKPSSSSSTTKWNLRSSIISYLSTIFQSISMVHLWCTGLIIYALLIHGENSIAMTWTAVLVTWTWHRLLPFWFCLLIHQV